ncbi:KdsC family phosphatase [Ichthyobacterium seriolicida]|uniref:3-deoxy-D-manno-octulosonate 8-phosphate phosphatase n=1 Tax=Ichthyobacterium seriolicida TaxID=242600 RepID=A0A1J1E802_9FLAO|nr:HAD hydrolase family protein [Ichthyobacterium seriolicida]BAV95470.1 3-deoxy-D-manno-octulosonate 8-phosphate phosphatase [Ichthyobacterium seriolicida]
MSNNYKELFSRVETFIFDVDGVMTDGKVNVISENNWARQMNIKDGYAINLAIKQGYNFCIISSGSNLLVKSRLQKLGITDFFFSCFDKLEAYEDYISTYDIREENTLYMGDDMPDYPVMKRVGVPACPNDAAIDIKNISKYISPYNGGNGCVRDVLEQIMRVQGKWIIPE